MLEKKNCTYLTKLQPYQRPSIANPYGRANVDEEVEVIVKEKLGRKCAVGGWLLRLVIHFIGLFWEIFHCVLMFLYGRI
jgi:hypothetical protein